jgi:hypothetical protein
MFDACRPWGRLFYWLLPMILVSAWLLAQTPALTTVSEVRWSDQGWGPDNDRNLVGRFGTQTFTVPRLTRVQTYFIRQYDASIPPKYSRHSGSLHVDYPL